MAPCPSQRYVSGARSDVMSIVGLGDSGARVIQNRGESGANMR